jgi:predicted dehydrogenase
MSQSDNSPAPTRRRFLGTAAAAASAPFILPSRIWSAEVKPNDRITMGFIGPGKQGRFLMGQFLGKSQVQGVAVCEVDQSRRESARKMVEDRYASKKDGAFKGCDAYVHHEELLARDDIDAVVIATPDFWHTPISLDAFKAGLDVYCEKPLTHTILEADLLMKSARTHKRILQTGSQQRSSREFRVACELVQNGVIGKVQRVECAFGGPPKPCDLPEEAMEPGLDWSRWLGPAPVRPYNSILSPRGVHNHFPHWRNYSEYGTGGVGDWGAHHLDIARWGLGHDATGPVEVVLPDGAKQGNGAILKFKDGTEILHGGGNGVTFYGETGKIVVNRGRFELWRGEEREFVSRNQLDQVEAKYLKPGCKELHRSNNHTDDFLTSVRNRKQPVAGVDIGAGTAICCHLLNIIYRTRKDIQWDPAKNTFASGGDPALLDKPRRVPFDKLG